MKQTIIGTYRAGYDKVRLVLTEGRGGEFWMNPSAEDPPTIKVGGDFDHWEDVLATLLHEVFEYATVRYHVRFEPTSCLSQDHTAYLFSMDHRQLTECCQMAGEYIAQCAPDLSKSWEKWKK